MNEEQIKHMTYRFLGWRLPESFLPDAGITYKRPEGLADDYPSPTGTNLFDYDQAEAMVRYMLEGMPTDL